MKDDSIEAVFVATDAPSHARHCIEVLKHGKHVATAVPACFGSRRGRRAILRSRERTTGLKYMMFETSYFHDDLHAMRQIYNAGGFGKLVYAEGEYYHYMEEPIDSYKGWRVGLPPQWYPTHSNAYYAGVTGGTFTEVSCMGMPSTIKHLQPAEQPLQEPVRHRDRPLPHERRRHRAHGRQLGHARRRRRDGPRPRAERGSFYDKYEGARKEAPRHEAPALAAHRRSRRPRRLARPPHQRIRPRDPARPQAAGRHQQALNMTVAGIVAHQSALKDGELMKIPQFTS